MLVIENIFKFIDYKINYYFNNNKLFTYNIGFEEFPDDKDEEYCNCNLCYLSRIFLYFFTRKLIYKKINEV